MTYLPTKPRVTKQEFKHLLELFSAWEGLKKLGWQEPRYFKWPPPFVEFEVIELGSTGIHRAVRFRTDDNPLDNVWIYGDAPSKPFLVRLKDSNKRSTVVVDSHEK